MDFATIATICATTIIIIWFILYMKNQNSKVLKEQAKIRENIEKGQRLGFEALSKDFEILSNNSKTIAKILEKIENNTRSN